MRDSCDKLNLPLQQVIVDSKWGIRKKRGRSEPKRKGEGEMESKSHCAADRSDVIMHQDAFNIGRTNLGLISGDLCLSASRYDSRQHSCSFASTRNLPEWKQSTCCARRRWRFAQTPRPSHDSSLPSHRRENSTRCSHLRWIVARKWWRG